MMNYEEFKTTLLKDLRCIDYQRKGLNVLIGNPGSSPAYRDALAASVKVGQDRFCMATDLTLLYNDYKGSSSYAEILKSIRESIEALPTRGLESEVRLCQSSETTPILSSVSHC